ncbi:MAG: phosphopyruvate hydratase [Patescibacteria group bacterium]
MAKIKKIIAREILDSRASPTIEAIIQLADGSVGIFSSPSGISIGKSEAHELRDHDLKRYRGLGVLVALEKIARDIAPHLIGIEASDQRQIDQILIALDNTKDKSNLGANTLLAISGACAKAQATSQKIPLYQYLAQLTGQNSSQFQIPTPMFNILNGGKHASFNLDFQEFMIVPPKANAYSKNLRIGVECYLALADVLKAHSAVTLVGDEGGFAPTLYSNMDALKILEEAVGRAGYRTGLDVFFSLDVAASHIQQGSTFRLKDKPVPLTVSDLIDFYITLNEQYHLLSLEDPLPEDDWQEWQQITQKLGGEMLIVGDDLIATNLERLERSIAQKACNSIVIKPNQIGTITETLDVVKKAKEANFKIVTSHRSGETNDDFIADFAVASGADYVKFGAPARGERVAKYNRLLEIEHELS